jgi:lambda family phage tail tape measure protein
MDIKTIFTIAASVTGGNAVKSLAGDLRNVSSVSDNVKRSFGLLGSALKGIGFATLAAGAVGFVRSGIDLADNLNDISQRTGVAVEMLAKYKVAADNSGSSIEDLAGGIGKLNKSIIAAQDGTTKQAYAFGALGINIRDAAGQIKPASQMIGEIADRFKNLEDGPAKTAVAMDLFGKAGANLIPFLNQGREELEKFGLAIDSDMAAKADAFNDQMGILKAQFTNLGLAITSELLPGMIAIGQSISENSVLTDTFVVAVRVLETAFVGLQTGASVILDYIAEKILLLINRAQTLGSVLSSFATLDWKGAEDAVKNGEQMADAIRKAGEEARKLANDQGAKALEAIWNPKAPAPKPAAAPKDQLPYNPGGAAKASRSADNEARKMADTVEDMKKKIAVLNQDTASITLNNAAREKGKLLAEFEARGIKQSSVLYQELSNAIDANTAAHRSFKAGAFEALNEYMDKLTDTAKMTKDAFTKAFQSIEDGLVEFLTTGKLSFKDFASSIIKDMARMAVQQGIMKPIMGVFSSILGGFTGGGGGGMNALSFAFKAATAASGSYGPGFANGGIMTDRGVATLQRYATGGIANRPQLAMFGEGRTPEAYVPLPDGRTIPVTMKGGANGGQINNVSVNVNMNGGSDDTQSNSKQGQDIGKMIASTVKQILLNEKRPGGLLATV